LRPLVEARRNAGLVLAVPILQPVRHGDRRGAFDEKRSRVGKYRGRRLRGGVYFVLAPRSLALSADVAACCRGGAISVTDASRMIVAKSTTAQRVTCI